MDERRDGIEHAAAVGALARGIADAMPALVETLTSARPGRVYREALMLLERPLLVQTLALTGGNQLRAARLLGVNRNTLRQRCRVLRLPLPGRAVSRAPRRAVVTPPTAR